MTQGNDSNGAWDERLDPVIADYLAALERGESSDRDALLTAHPELADALRDFFADHDRMRRLASPAGGFPELTGPYQSSAEPDLAGTVVAGRYKLLQRIGEGGMGTVYMAEQTTPVKRQVAVKLIKPGMDSRQVLARFEAERQALALMDHPNIAKVLDGGTTTGEPGGVSPGRPYFVMELVKGLPITQYCDEKRLSVGQRLDLFRQVCAAVQHAHQKGVIHRDLKPTNVLVTEHDGKPVPKVIDFGLAKALHAPGLLTEKTLFTAFGTAVGTPLHMAPEQVGINALDVDTRVDIYALGVLLYELLTGSTPVERQRLKAAAWEEMRRLIREEEPPRPSQRLSTSDGLPSIAACRDTEPAKLGRLVRGDLDWIVMKALEKDRDRRYETATAFAEDVRRFLADEPVAAGPPTLGYRLRKFVRRNRAAVAAVGLIGLAVLLAVGGLTWGLIQTQWALDRVTEEEKKTREALTEADSQRKKAEAYAASIRIDLDLSERSAALLVLRLAETLQTIKDHSPELRQYLTLKILSEGQKLEPLVGPFTRDGFPESKRALSPGGRFLLAWGWDETWRVSETLTGRPVVTFPVGEDVDRGVFRNSGRLISWKDGGRVVRLWDTTGKSHVESDPCHHPTLKDGDVGREVVFSPDQRRLIVVARPLLDQGVTPQPWQTHVELFDSSTGRRVAVLQEASNSVAFSPDNRWLLTGGHDGKPRAWSIADGRLVRILDGHPGSVHWVGINPTSTFACTVCDKELQWWRLPDWQSAGPPSPSDILHGVVSGAFPHPGLVAIRCQFDGEFTTNLFSGVGVFRQGHRESVGWDDLGDKRDVVASDGRKLLMDSGVIYDLDQERRVQFAPAGRKYHPDVRKLNGGGRLVLTSIGIIDLVTEKVIGVGANCRPISAPGCFCVGETNRVLDITLSHNDFDINSRTLSPIIIPSLDIDIPPTTLKLWAEVVTRGQLNVQGEFVKLHENEWETKRQELAAASRPVGAFPFPGPVAQDRLYWLRQEVGKVGDKEAIPLLDRLVAAEPTWPNYLRRARFRGDSILAARDFLEAGRLAGPRFWRLQSDEVNDYVMNLVRRPGIRPDDTETAMTLAGKVPSERQSDLAIGTLLYRLGRYPEALARLTREERKQIAGRAVAALASPWVAPLLKQEVPGNYPTEAVIAMCLFRLDQRDAAKARLALARQGVDQERRRFLQEHPHLADFPPSPETHGKDLVLVHEAEALIEGKKP